jgi:hypothetical protein
MSSPHDLSDIFRAALYSVTLYQLAPTAVPGNDHNIPSTENGHDYTHVFNAIR